LIIVAKFPVHRLCIPHFAEKQEATLDYLGMGSCSYKSTLLNVCISIFLNVLVIRIRLDFPPGYKVLRILYIAVLLS
jgi:hypothetical protein